MSVCACMSLCHASVHVLACMLLMKMHAYLLDWGKLMTLNLLCKFVKINLLRTDSLRLSVASRDGPV